MDDAGLVHGPVDEGSLAVDEGAGNGAEIAAVAGDAAVVTHDPEVALGNDNVGQGAVVAVTEGDVGFVEGEAIDQDLAMINAEVVAGKGYDALDVALGVVAGVEEDDDVAAMDGLEAVGEFVDEEAVLIFEAREHAGAFNADRLIEKQDDEEGDGDGDEHVAGPGTPARGRDDGGRF